MPQLKKSYNEITVPLQKMSFTPDVPSSALGANEYNVGENVETDVRGIRSVSGEEEILGTVPCIPTYITGGFRPTGDGGAEEWWFIVAGQDGKWYMNNGNSGWTDITPAASTGYDGSQYNQAINITDAWNGTVVIFNDTFNAPFFLPDTATKLVMYKSNLPPQSIDSLTVDYPVVGQVTITVATDYNRAIGEHPFGAGDKILISNSNTFFNGEYTVVSSVVVSATQTDIVYTATPGGAYPGTGTVSAAYTWNYNPNWKGLTAEFLRIYSTPNVGNILVAGNLTATLLDDSIARFPVTVQWSQAFGLNQAPLTFEPTILNVANQVEIPVRGELVDAFPSNGQLFIGSYWDTAVLTPMNYSTTSAPILGIRLFNQGRGMITSNCWANTDERVYGIDARDIWVFNGQTFTGIGNQRIRHWFFDQIDPKFVDRIYMETNTEKNQIEIYYPDRDVDQFGESAGVPNKMISYRYDLDVWNPPRYVSKATFGCEAPVWTNTAYYYEVSTVTATGIGSGLTVTIRRTGNDYYLHKVVNPGTNYAVGDLVTVLGTDLGGLTPDNDCTLTVTEIQTGGGVVAATASGTPEWAWVYNKASRGIVYAKGATGKKLIQKDQGYRFVDNQVIMSTFRRDNIRLVQDYSTKTLVHRILPAIVNLKEDNAPINPAVDTELIGNVYGTIEGANSVGQPAQTVVSYAISTDTDQPWIQINQNVHRVNSIEMTNDITTPDTIWMCNSITFQFTEVEDDR